MTVQERRPDRIGPYRLLERLGEGGMGVVYLAADAEHRRVAVKALRPAVAADPNARRRLAREVETMRRVRSPFVAEVIDADVTSDPPYIVTRYVSGRTLEDVVSESGPLTGQQLARLANGLALALAAVHAAGVVHRDFKPGNVMIARGEPVVIDFGIAQAPDSTRLTMTGMFMGTPGYLAPEVIEGKPSGPASDVHSWGATVAFAATGRPPFGTGAFETIFYRIINGQPDLSGFPAPLLSLVGQALARDPAHRPSAAELCQRTAALDPLSLVPAAASAAGSPLAMPLTVTDWPAPPRTALANGAAGAAPAPPAAWPPHTRPMAAGAAASAGAPAARPGEQGGGAGLGPGGYGDVLPPVRYPPQGPAPAGPAQPPAPQRAGRSPAGPLLVAASLAAAIAISVVFPVAGTLVAIAALIGLRAGGQTAASLSRRRARRGSRAGDPLLAVVLFPPALAWSAVRSVLVLPLAAAAAAAAAVITVVVVPAQPIPVACAYGAGALVACYGLGPGSGGSRKPIRSLFDAVACTRIRSATAFIALAAVVIAAMVVAASHPPFFWPLGNLTGWLGHFNVVHTLVHGIRSRALRVIGRHLS